MANTKKTFKDFLSENQNFWEDVGLSLYEDSDQDFVTYKYLKENYYTSSEVDENFVKNETIENYWSKDELLPNLNEYETNEKSYIYRTSLSTNQHTNYSTLTLTRYSHSFVEDTTSSANGSVSVAKLYVGGSYQQILNNTDGINLDDYYRSKSNLVISDTISSQVYVYLVTLSHSDSDDDNYNYNLDLGLYLKTFASGTSLTLNPKLHTRFLKDSLGNKYNLISITEFTNDLFIKDLQDGYLEDTYHIIGTDETPLYLQTLQFDEINENGEIEKETYYHAIDSERSLLPIKTLTSVHVFSNGNSIGQVYSPNGTNITLPTQSYTHFIYIHPTGAVISGTFYYFFITVTTTSSDAYTLQTFRELLQTINQPISCTGARFGNTGSQTTFPNICAIQYESDETALVYAFIVDPTDPTNNGISSFSVEFSDDKGYVFDDVVI